LAQEEMASEGGATYRAMIEASASGRVGTSDEVRSFLIAPLPKGRGGTAVALDQAGASMGSYPVERRP
jgi:hypothetical protein